MARITTIYSNLAALSVLYNGVAPRVYGLDATPLSVPTATLPCRVLVPGRSTQGTFGFVAIGTMISVIWTIDDVLLITPAAQGVGLVAVSTAMLTYCGDYAQALRAFRAGGMTGGQTVL